MKGDTDAIWQTLRCALNERQHGIFGALMNFGADTISLSRSILRAFKRFALNFERKRRRSVPDIALQRAQIETGAFGMNN